MSLPVVDTKAHQDLLKRVAQNLNVQTEVVVEDSDLMIDILSPEGPSRCRCDKSIPDRSAVDACTPPQRGAEAESTGDRWPSTLSHEDTRNMASPHNL
ncbi:hypothetical protein UY3_08672 [Chelonia mydas]|uniref:Uncharacterized protein n=1 Tax=Chelonia mydas TaxID=8469 RepID=M7C1A2_CHEMY|nr:hypothetical protein UY3_08672 [Chelonia mydas]